MIREVAAADVPPDWSLQALAAVVTPAAVDAAVVACGARECAAPPSSSHVQCLLGAELRWAAIPVRLMRARGVVPADPGRDRLVLEALFVARPAA